MQAQVAREADLARSTLNDIVAGRQWPDVVTVAKLEHVLEVRLWPEWPPGAGSRRSRR
ncbi:MAG TPA: helix-turn-helix transcriptional regulator [Frankiaceae bacterium]|nr:helix-turn-helix transcriptional regulator [Frankiaceae bacterium]